MKKTFLTALVALFGVTVQAQVNPKMQALFDQLKELGETPHITKTGGTIVDFPECRNAIKRPLCGFSLNTSNKKSVII